MIFLIASHRLSKLFLVPCNIQDIVLDLKGQTDIPAHGLNLFQFFGSRQNRSRHKGSFYKGRGLIHINIIQPFSFQRPAVIFHIYALSPQHAPDPGLFGQDLEGFGCSLHLPGIFCQRKTFKRRLICIIQQSVSCQDRCGFSEYDMGGLLSPAVFVIVNSRKIVMDQGMGMNHLNGCHKRLRQFFLSPEDVIHLSQENRPQTFPPCFHTVIHGFYEIF